MQTPHRKLPADLTPRNLLLWGNSANYTLTKVTHLKSGKHWTIKQQNHFPILLQVPLFHTMLHQSS